MLAVHLLVSIVAAFLSAGLALAFDASVLMAMGWYVLGSILGLAGSAAVGLCVSFFGRGHEADERDPVGWTASLRSWTFS